MSGRHADHTVHRIVSGQPPTVGLRVLDYDRKPGTITTVSDRDGCGWYCNAWHTVTRDDGGQSLMNCERLTAL